MAPILIEDGEYLLASIHQLGLNSKLLWEYFNQDIKVLQTLGQTEGLQQRHLFGCQMGMPIWIGTS